MTKGKRKYMNDASASVHVGDMLAAYIDKHRIHQAAMARAMNRNLSTVLDYKKRPSIQTAILWELCHVLQHNFFADMAMQLPGTFTSAASAIPDDRDAEILRLQEAVKLLQHDKEMLLQLLKSKMV